MRSPFLLGIGTLVQARGQRQCVRDAPCRTRRRPMARRSVHGGHRDRAGAWPLACWRSIAYAFSDFAALSRWATQNPGIAVTIAFVADVDLMLGAGAARRGHGPDRHRRAALFIGFAPAMSAFATEATSFLTNSQVATLPLFLMMGSFAAVSGMADDMYRLGHVLLSRYRGGLALATIGGCAGFGALTGSSLATAATIGRVAIPEMRARGYSPALATGCCAAGGTLGPDRPARAPDRSSCLRC